jgi:hypothetical protein
MITVLLLAEDKRQPLARVRSEGSERFIAREDPRYPLLSLVDMFSTTMFHEKDVPQLLAELERLLGEIPADDVGARIGLDSIIELGRRAQVTKGACLFFTPFEEPK